MSFKSTAQYVGEIIVDELPSDHIVLEPISIVEPEELVVEEHSPESEFSAEPVEIVVEDLGEIPGLSGSLDPEKEHALEVVDESEEDKSEANDSKKPKKDEKWDWESKGASGFVAWVNSRFESIPGHSGYDSAGLERAVSFLEKLDNEISKAMRLDLDGDLDSDKIEDIRAKIEEGIERLHQRLDKVKGKKKKKKKASESVEIVKEAQKITGVAGIYVTVPLLISRIARVCINGTVSAGHDIEQIFVDQCKKYKLTDREKAETIQLMADMGYPMRQDRGYLTDEDVDETDGQYDWNSNYQA